MQTLSITQEQATYFFDEVLKMRQLQRNYFKTRAFKLLSASKKQEAKIDSIIETFLFNQSESKEITLFSSLISNDTSSLT